MVFPLTVARRSAKGAFFRVTHSEASIAPNDLLGLKFENGRVPQNSTWGTLQCGFCYFSTELVCSRARFWNARLAAMRSAHPRPTRSETQKRGAAPLLSRRSINPKWRTAITAPTKTMLLRLLAECFFV